MTVRTHYHRVEGGRNYGTYEFKTVAEMARIVNGGDVVACACAEGADFLDGKRGSLVERHLAIEEKPSVCCPVCRGRWPCASCGLLTLDLAEILP